jgi:hypothetical protein
MSLAIIDSSKSYPPYEVVHELEGCERQERFYHPGRANHVVFAQTLVSR